MSEEQIRKQLLELDCPHLCRLTVTVEVHPRCVALCHDGKEDDSRDAQQAGQDLWHCVKKVA